MTNRAQRRLAPGGSAIPLQALARVLAGSDAAGELEHSMQTRFPHSRLTYHASGREAMRVALSRIAQRSGRSEVAIPAYGCFSIPASVVAAGLQVRLVDVDDDGRLSPEALEQIPLDRVAAIVFGNLFGLPEPVAVWTERARAAGAAVVDDAAQALGATAADGVVGSRGDVGILSFGRGKPLSALGGGAAIWSNPEFASDRANEGEAPAPATTAETGCARPERLAGIARGLAYDLSRRPAVLGLLAAIPALQIGKTHYAVDFERGRMPGAAVALAAALAPELDRLNAGRRESARALAERIRGGTEFRPLIEPTGACGVFPRLGLLAPSRDRRDRALDALVSHGATAMYPTPLDAIRALVPHRSEDRACPGATRFCERLLTLPTHAGLRPAHVDAVVEILARS